MASSSPVETRSNGGVAGVAQENAEVPRKRQKRTTEDATREMIRQNIARLEELSQQSSSQEGNVQSSSARARHADNHSESEAASAGDDTERIDSIPVTNRRAKMMWTPEEEDFLVEGVRRAGIGRWAIILKNGKNVFHRHRKSADLKDKWRNLVRRVETPVDDVTESARSEHEKRMIQHVKQMLPFLNRGQRPEPQQRQTRSTRGKENQPEPEMEEDDPVVGDSSDGVTDNATAKTTRPRTQSEDASGIELDIVTDATFPQLVRLSISLREYQTVSALKRELARRLLEHALIPTNLQLIAISTRRLLADLESVEDTIEMDGKQLYLLYDA